MLTKLSHFNRGLVTGIFYPCLALFFTVAGARLAVHYVAVKLESCYSDPAAIDLSCFDHLRKDLGK